MLAQITQGFTFERNGRDRSSFFTDFRETTGLFLVTDPVLRFTYRAICETRTRQIDLCVQIKCTSCLVPQFSESEIRTTESQLFDTKKRKD